MINNLRVLHNCYRIITRNARNLEIATLNSCVPHRRTISEIAQPTPEGSQREYPPKITNIVTEISKLSLLEVSELNELLKKTLRIPDTPMMGYAVGNVALAAKVEDEEEKQQAATKSSFTVKLVKFDADKKVQLIKEMKTLIAGMNLVQAKKFVESLPQIVKPDLSKAEADQLVEKIKAAGGQCEIE